jgi:hypothetical protein
MSPDSVGEVLTDPDRTIFVYVFPAGIGGTAVAWKSGLLAEITRSSAWWVDVNKVKSWWFPRRYSCRSEAEARELAGLILSGEFLPDRVAAVVRLRWVRPRPRPVS